MIVQSKDPDYEDNYIKPEISKKLSDEFPDELNKSDVMIRNQFRDKILYIVKNAKKVLKKIIKSNYIYFKIINLIFRLKKNAFDLL
jgi:hypothetical protein